MRATCRLPRLRWPAAPAAARRPARSGSSRSHIGAKDFTENMILAEMMAAMIEQEGIPVQRSIPYGNTFVTFEALKQGRIDLYPEYNGTGLILLGQPPTADGDAAMERVAHALRRPRPRPGATASASPTTTCWRCGPSGRRRWASSTISDLARLPEVRFAVDEDFTKRPLDGLGALVRRYGLRQGAARDPQAGRGRRQGPDRPGAARGRRRRRRAVPHRRADRGVRAGRPRGRPRASSRSTRRRRWSRDAALQRFPAVAAALAQARRQGHERGHAADERRGRARRPDGAQRRLWAS